MLDTAVIPCGGLGTRLAPITRWLPKEMLPVGLRPVLHWVLDEAADAGLVRAVVVTNPLKPVLEAAARTYPGPLELEFVPQDHPHGLGDALLRARDQLEAAAFAVLLPDHLFQGPNPTRAVIETHRATGLATVLLSESPPKDPDADEPSTRVTTARAADGTLRVTGLGAGSARLAGRAVFPGDVFLEFDAVARDLPPGSELDDRPVLERLARRGALAAVLSRATLYEVGLPEGYRDAVAGFPARA